MKVLKSIEFGIVSTKTATNMQDFRHSYLCDKKIGKRGEWIDS